jgi:quercetin 2,3-dioxygenase
LSLFENRPILAISQNKFADGSKETLSMITIRSAQDRGHARFSWLDSHHTFSFGDYYDPNHMGFRSLRVINEDRVDPAAGFATHSHRDMEILTFVLDGAVEHKDSIGNVATIRPGEIQRMTAGTGISHSEYNPSEQDIAHFLQIWILPDRAGLNPSYEQIAFPLEERLGQWRLIASPDGRDGSVTIHQDVALYTAVLAPEQQVSYNLQPDRSAWLQVARGVVALNGQTIQAGDGVAIEVEQSFTVQASQDAEILLFDLA